MQFMDYDYAGKEDQARPLLKSIKKLEVKLYIF